MSLNSKKLTTLQFKKIVRNYGAAIGQDFNNVTIRNLYEQYINNVHVNAVAIAFEFSETLVKKYHHENKMLHSKNQIALPDKQQERLNVILGVLSTGAKNITQVAELAYLTEQMARTYLNKLIDQEQVLIGSIVMNKSRIKIYTLANKQEGVAV